jgi:hypothetical protein
MSEMYKLRCFFNEVIQEAISEEDVKWWTDSYRQHTFDSPEEAREFIFQQKEYARKQGWGGSTKESRKFANEFPVEKIGSKYRIGAKSTPKTFDWKNVQIRTNSQEEASTLGLLNPFDGERLSKVKLLPIQQLVSTEQHSQTKQGQLKVKRIANSLQKSDNPFFVPVIVEPSGAIADGHHRYEAVKSLKLKEIPVQVILGRS